METYTARRLVCEKLIVHTADSSLLLVPDITSVDSVVLKHNDYYKYLTALLVVSIRYYFSDAKKPLRCVKY